MQFESSSEIFPVKDHTIYLNHCGVSPMYSQASQASQQFDEQHTRLGIQVFSEYPDVLPRLHQAAAQLLETGSENISFMKNTAEGLSLIAGGYPFAEGDEIISYVHEYPSNHYPWLLQQKRGAKLILLDDHRPNSHPASERRHVPTGSWSLDQLLQNITDKTRIITLSHVQFTSGFAADLEQLGQLCQQKGIDLIVDAAQSLGALPLYPEKWHIAAVAASGWKWLLGPIGSGILYTSSSLRQKLEYTAAGADIVEQGDDYLDHSWRPYSDGRRFEYSTVPVADAVALTVCCNQLFNHYGIEKIRSYLMELRAHILEKIDTDFFNPVQYKPRNQSTINSFLLPPESDPLEFSKMAQKRGVVCSSRGGYLRLAPHFYITQDELDTALGILNELAAEIRKGS